MFEETPSVISVTSPNLSIVGFSQGVLVELLGFSAFTRLCVFFVLSSFIGYWIGFWINELNTDGEDGRAKGVSQVFSSQRSVDIAIHSAARLVFGW